MGTQDNPFEAIFPAMSRNPVFQCGRRGHHEGAPAEIDVTNGHFRVRTWGPNFNQDDADVWRMALLTVLMAGVDGDSFTLRWNSAPAVPFSFNQWCRDLQRSENSITTNEAIKNGLARMRLTAISVLDTESAAEYRALMVEDFGKDDSGYWVRMDPRIVRAFAKTTWMHDVRHRCALNTFFAKWFFDFLASDSRTKMSMNLNTLREASGAQHYEPGKFRRLVKNAVEQLIEPVTVKGTNETLPPILLEAKLTEGDVLHIVKAKRQVVKPRPVEDIVRETWTQKQPMEVTGSHPTTVAPKVTDRATDGRRGVFVVTTAASVSDGMIDFQSRLARFGNRIDGVVRMKPAKKDQDNTRHLAGAIMTLIDTYHPQRGDIVAIVRGGGADEQFTMFNAPASIDAIETLRNAGVFVIAGVGHTKDRWAIDAHLDYVAEVPFAAAEFVNRQLQLANNRPRIVPQRSHFPKRGSVNRHPAVQQHPALA
ncbi:TPA: hypothetical protein QDB45_001712 [Burkholderia vietnamiensis]|nr:hypothetical protein [Burkholderia vietnamiensis]